jgi:hypothetical protein
MGKGHPFGPGYARKNSTKTTPKSVTKKRGKRKTGKKRAREK